MNFNLGFALLVIETVLSYVSPACKYATTLEQLSGLFEGEGLGVGVLLLLELLLLLLVLLLLLFLLLFELLL